jgi:hypothetical protein
MGDYAAAGDVLFPSEPTRERGAEARGGKIPSQLVPELGAGTTLYTIAPPEPPVPTMEFELTPSWEVPGLSEYTVKLAKYWIGTRMKQNAIDAILDQVKSTQMPYLEQCVRMTMIYDSSLVDDGETRGDLQHRNIEVRIGDGAFNSVAWLYTVMTHEYEHVFQRFQYPLAVYPLTDETMRAMREFEAYSSNIFNAYETGVIWEPDKMKSLGIRLKENYDRMAPADQANNQSIYEDAIHFIKLAISDFSWHP